MASNNESKRVATTRPEHRRGMTKTQIRNERRQRSEARKKRRRTFYAVGGGALGLIFILSMTLGGIGNAFGNNSSSGEGNELNTGGPVPLDPDDGQDHILPGQGGFAYSVKPATSGPHWFSATTPAGVPAPARWGEYDFPLPDEVLIHNLEHGGIGLHYDCPNGCDDLVDELRDLMPANKAQFILSPYSGLETTIAITAWRHHLFLDTFDEEQIREFIREYKDRAPESIPGNSF